MVNVTRLMHAFIVLALTTLWNSPVLADNSESVKQKGTTATSNKNTVTYIETTTIALRGKPFYPPDFKHFDYANPNAPQGGNLKDYTIGTFDNFNPYSQRGDAAIGSSSIYDDLMSSSDDDLSAYYPLIAKKIKYASDFSSITFYIDEKARFQDGKPIKPSDIKFSFTKLTEEGLPGLKTYYSFVDNIEVGDNNSVTFSLKTNDKSKMMALCGLTVFPEHFWKDHRLDEPLKTVPVGSGAYRIGDYKYGKYVTLKRIDEYWAKDLPVMKGQLNADSVRYEYYRDQTVAFEAFKAGHIDIWQENTAKQWAKAYTFPAIKDKRVIKEDIAHEKPLRMQAFIFNTKKPQFQDRRVRQALAYLMDFEWLNKNLFYSQYMRVESFFMNTEYRATGLPGEDEMPFFKSIKDKVPESIFTEPFKLPKTNGSGNIRSHLRQALRLLKQAGWVIKNQKLTHVKTGKPFTFELLLVSPSMEKVALPYKKNLARAGIDMSVRTVDTSQYMNLRIKHDYDMIISGYGPYAYPSPRMNQQWHSDHIDSGFNLANVEDEVVDYLMTEALKYQTDEPKLLAIGKVIDRVLLANYYVIPQWSSTTYRVAYWNKFSKPKRNPKYSLAEHTWWFDQEKIKKLNAGRD